MLGLFKFNKITIKIRHLLARNKILVFAIFITFLILDILINSKISTTITLFLLVFWLTNIFNLNLKPIHSLILATYFYLLSFLGQFFSNELVAEKAVSWFFIFLAVALIQQLVKKVPSDAAKI